MVSRDSDTQAFESKKVLEVVIKLLEYLDQLTEIVFEKNAGERGQRLGISKVYRALLRFS